MQKTISALEQLERFAVQSDAEVATIEGLRATVRHLELEEVKRNEERQRNDRVRLIKRTGRWKIICVCSAPLWFLISSLLDCFKHQRGRSYLESMR